MYIVIMVITLITRPGPIKVRGGVFGVEIASLNHFRCLVYADS